MIEYIGNTPLVELKYFSELLSLGGITISPKIFKSISFLSIIRLTLEFFAINFANEVYENPNFIVSLAL